jgi:hypothetical protein
MINDETTTERDERTTPPYETPRITELGTLTELTLGGVGGSGTDGTFTGSTA